MLFQPRTLLQYSAVRFDSRSSYKNYLYIHLMLTSITLASCKLNMLAYFYQALLNRRRKERKYSKERANAR